MGLDLGDPLKTGTAARPRFRRAPVPQRSIGPRSEYKQITHAWKMVGTKANTSGQYPELGPNEEAEKCWTPSRPGPLRGPGFDALRGQRLLKKCDREGEAPEKTRGSLAREQAVAHGKAERPSQRHGSGYKSAPRGKTIIGSEHAQVRIGTT